MTEPAFGWRAPSWNSLRTPVAVPATAASPAIKLSVDGVMPVSVPDEVLVTSLRPRSAGCAVVSRTAPGEVSVAVREVSTTTPGTVIP